uniref:F-box/LRR-repeat protein n=1 Tax=Timema bartmani TaxID=61472 RepID=A0A7R9ESB5_9NEOP|nr:unnamed protein product [Timema bartmani]
MAQVMSVLNRFALVPKMLGPCGAGTLQPLLCRLCLNCPQLTELVLKDSVKGSDTMAFIGKTCHRLRLLDITGSRVVCSDLIRLCVRSPHRALQDFTANSTEQNVYDYDLNPLCQTLEIVLLENTRVKIKGGVFVMKAMPNLESLGNFLYTAAALKKIYGLRGKPKPCFKLKKAFYRGPSTAKLQVLANCCPLLESLYFGSNEVRRICPRILSTFKMLRSLALENIYHTDLMEALKYTPHLIELEVYSSVDFGIVGQFCPLLEKLKVGKEPLRAVTLPSDDTKLYSRLQDLKITVPISLECGALFMSRATQLRNVEITKIRDVTDGLFEEWLRLNPLEHLESLMLRYVELTRDSVNLLLSRCPRLTRLGELGGWDIRSWECRRLKDLILRENYALHLVLYTRTSLNIGDIISDNVNSEESGMEWD